MTLPSDPGSIEGRRRELRRLLIGRQIMYPAMAYGLLGYDPNKLDLDDQLAICDDLRVLGYEPRSRRRPYSSARTMTWWLREADWPEDILGAAPYVGIPLVPDPDLMDWTDD